MLITLISGSVYSTHQNLLGNINWAQKHSGERDHRTKRLCFFTLRNLAFKSNLYLFIKEFSIPVEESGVGAGATREPAEVRDPVPARL